MFFFFIIFFKIIPIPAWLVLIYWFGVQAATAYMSPVSAEVSGGVAVWAHIGGFIAGMLLVKVFEDRRLVAERNAIREHQQWYAIPRG
jgi:membrane associated rhomboid family serine protease